MTALNSRKAIDKVLKWLISQATLLDWIHWERLFVEWQIIRLHNRKVLSMLSTRRFSAGNSIWHTLHAEVSRQKSAYVKQQQTLKSK